MSHVERAWLKEYVMSCHHHLLNAHWDRHKWVRRVVGTEYLPAAEVNMWGRPFYGTTVRCDTEYACERCGVTKRHESCICDRVEGEKCPPRLAYLRK